MDIHLIEESEDGLKSVLRHANFHTFDTDNGLFVFDGCLKFFGILPCVFHVETDDGSFKINVTKINRVKKLITVTDCKCKDLFECCHIDFSPEHTFEMYFDVISFLKIFNPYNRQDSRHLGILIVQ